MSYDDFWFIDTRVQTTNLRRWFTWFIFLFAFVTIGSIMAVKTMYHDIEVVTKNETNFEIKVSEAKTTNVNGYVKGEIINKQEEEINKKYLCFVLCNSNDEIISTEYIEIEKLEERQAKSYELKFKHNKVDMVYVLVTDSKIK